jgi:[protein-PII] uridylyltransferase
MDHAARPAFLRAQVKAARERIGQRLANGAGGVVACAELARTYDALLGALWDTAMREIPGAAATDLALVATGGWGRNHVCPYSDLDFAVLTRKPESEVGRRVADHLLYPLWDAGIKVGHAIREPKAAARLARTDLATATALLEAHALAGDTRLVADLARATERVVSRERTVNDFVRSLVDEKRRRHDRFGASLYLLEPNLKQGIGALRDLATGMWVARARWGVEEIAQLIDLGQLSARQVAVYNEALDFLLKLRCLVHLHAGRVTDQLTFELQEALAPGLYPDAKLEEGDVRPAVAPAVEALMRRYYLHARAASRVTERLLELALVPPRKKPRILRIDGSFVAFNGKLSLVDPDLLRARPAEMVRLFRVALREDLPVYGHTRELIAERLAENANLVTENVAAGKLFVEFLVDPADKGQPSLLEIMHDLGLLNALMPEFAPCTCRVQHDLYHVYTVDQHQLYTVAYLKRLARGELRDDAPTVTEALAQVTRPISLYLGTLLHDVGKPLGRGHSEKGARLAGAIARRFHLTPEDTGRTELLVRQHLTMAHLSQRRDLSDDAMIERFADRMGDEETLAQLYVLTFCDTAMTAPGNLNEWKQALLRELYVKARARLRGQRGTDISSETEAAARRVRKLVRELCADEGSVGDDELAEFFRGVDDRYFAALAPPQIARHVALAREYRERGVGARVAVIHHDPGKGHSAVAVVARDRHGFLAMVAGALAANRVDILSAVVSSRQASGAGEEPLALDVFFVRDTLGNAIERDDPRWQRIEEDLAGLLASDRADPQVVRALLKRRRQRSGLGQRVMPAVPTRIAIDNETSTDYTVVDVIAEDRVGLLCEIALTLTQLELDIHLSKVATEANRVADVFYVTAGTPPQKIVDPERLAVIEKTLFAAVSSHAES